MKNQMQDFCSNPKRTKKKKKKKKETSKVWSCSYSRELSFRAPALSSATFCRRFWGKKFGSQQLLGRRKCQAQSPCRWLRWEGPLWMGQERWTLSAFDAHASRAFVLEKDSSTASVTCTLPGLVTLRGAQEPCIITSRPTLWQWDGTINWNNMAWGRDSFPKTGFREFQITYMSCQASY